MIDRIDGIVDCRSPYSSQSPLGLGPFSSALKLGAGEARDLNDDQVRYGTMDDCETVGRRFEYQESNNLMNKQRYVH